jgi:hypothetical protein
MNQKCQFCRWWDLPEANPGLSEATHRESVATYIPRDCRRHAPVTLEIRSGNYIEYRRFPQVCGKDWCGDFQHV